MHAMPISRSLPAVVVVALSAVALSVTLLAQGINLRTGSWEYQMTVEGAIPMDGIPENMRASMEAELRKPRVVKSCMTAEDLKNLRLGKTDDGDDEECKVLSSKVGPTGGDISRECTGDRPRTETIHVEASSPQAMRAVVTSKAAQGTMTTTMVGRWLAAQCRD
jgi:hypothetical protein